MVLSKSPRWLSGAGSSTRPSWFLCLFLCSLPRVGTWLLPASPKVKWKPEPRPTLVRTWIGASVPVFYSRLEQFSRGLSDATALPPTLSSRLLSLYAPLPNFSPLNRWDLVPWPRILCFQTGLFVSGRELWLPSPLPICAFPLLGTNSLPCWSW